MTPSDTLALSRMIPGGRYETVALGSLPWTGVCRAVNANVAGMITGIGVDETGTTSVTLTVTPGTNPLGFRLITAVSGVTALVALS